MEDEFFLPLLKAARSSSESGDDEINSFPPTTTCDDGGPKIRPSKGKMDEAEVETKSDIQKAKKGDVPNSESLSQMIKKLLKKARLFEIRRMTRNVNLLKNKRGTDQELAKNERKYKRLLQQIQILKKMPLDFFSKEIEISMTSEQLGFDRFFDENTWETKWAPEVDTQDKEIYLTFMNAKKLKPKLLELKKKLEEGVFSTKNSYNESSGSIEKNKSEEIGNSLMEVEQKSESDASLASGKPGGDTNLIGITSNDVEPTCNEGQMDKESDTPRKLANQKEQKKPKQKTNSKLGKTSRGRKGNKKESSLPRGVELTKKKKSRVENHEKVAKKVEKLQPINLFSNSESRLKSNKITSGRKGNRLGQRARRQMWEKMYGQQATHVAKGLPPRKRKEPQHRSKKDPNFPKTGRVGQENGFPQKKSRKDEDVSKLHPSWQAKKQMKKQTGILEFKGAKIVFE